MNSMKIYEQKNYINGSGEMIQGRTEIIQEGQGYAKQVVSPETFHSIGVLQFSINGQPAQSQFSCDIPGETIEEAFANFPAAMELAREKAAAGIQAQLVANEAKARQQIILAGAIQPPNGNGRPITRLAR